MGNRGYDTDRSVRYMCRHTGIPYEKWTGMSGEERTAFGRRFPSVMGIPNRAQARVMDVWREAPYPRIHLVTFGNGTGKTDWLGEFLAGCAKGPQYVNHRYCDCRFFHELDAKRKDGTLTIWWVCDGDLMKENAPDFKTIKSHIPDAKFKNKSNNGVYGEIHIPTKGEDGKAKMIVVMVKTHGEDSQSYAGENVDVVICDEPPKEEHWAEMVGRLRSKKGEVGARIVIGATPLKLAGFLYSLTEDPDFADKVRLDRGSLWENCAGDELPDEEAKRLGIEWDEDENCWGTRGHLTLESIQDQIAFWSKSKDPDEMKARVDGEFTHVAGRIYKVFSRQHHTIPPYKIPEHYPVVMIADPHDARPDAAGWYAITPRNKGVCIGEYPTRPYEMCNSRTEDIPQTCETWHMMEEEMGISGQIIARYGDPNKFLDPDPYTGMTMQKLYAKHGFHFNVHVNDRLSFGHELVRQFLACDKMMLEQRPGDPTYQPKLVFFDTCTNHINYMVNYSTKSHRDPGRVIEVVDDKWKDFCDLVRYFCVTFAPYDAVTGLSAKAEWAAIKAAREPSLSREPKILVPMPAGY